jgi:hypothetical protein
VSDQLPSLSWTQRGTITVGILYREPLIRLNSRNATPSMNMPERKPTTAMTIKIHLWTLSVVRFRPNTTVEATTIVAVPHAACFHICELSSVIIPSALPLAGLVAVVAAAVVAAAVVAAVVVAAAVVAAAVVVVAVAAVLFESAESTSWSRS